MSQPALPTDLQLVDLLLDAVCVVDTQGRFVYVSAAFERIFGYAPKEVIGRTMIDLVRPEDRERTLQTARGVMAGAPQFNFENRYIRKDGRTVDILWSARWSAGDQLRIGVARDISERRQAETRQAAVYELALAADQVGETSVLFERAQDIVSRLLPTRAFTVVLGDNAAADVAYHGRSADVATQFAGPEEGGLPAAPKAVPTVLAADRRTEVLALALQAVQTASAVRCATAAASAATDPAVAAQLLAVPLRSQATIFGALVVEQGGGTYAEHDIELLQFVAHQLAAAIERSRLRLRLQHMAQFDTLTDLPNRALLADRLRTTLARSQRDKSRLALLYIDLDRFKQINDTRGHAAGDQLLRQAAHRLSQTLRACDTVARLGGDEFVVLLERCDSAAEASCVAEKLRTAFEAPFDIAGEMLTVRLSIGVAVHPDHGTDVATLMDHADRAMYRAKRDGGNRVCVAARSEPQANRESLPQSTPDPEPA